MMKQLRRNNRGDTIVEVLIVLAVLGLAFAVSYSTATGALSKSRNAQEHSEALNLLNTQIERMRVAVANSVALPMNPGSPVTFCINDSGAVETNLANCVDSQYSRYKFTAVYVPVSSSELQKNYFDIKVVWDGVSSLGKQNVESTYKLYPLAADTSSQTQIQASPASINVVVQKLKPDTPAHDSSIDPTPSCKVNGVDNTNYDTPPSSTKVNLTSLTPGASSGLTTPSSGTTSGGTSVSFTNLTDHGTYKTDVTFPNTYEVCPSTLTSNTISDIKGPHTVAVTIRPKCIAQPQTHDWLKYDHDWIKYDHDWIKYDHDYLYNGSDYIGPQYYWVFFTTITVTYPGYTPQYGAEHVTGVWPFGYVAPTPTSDGMWAFEYKDALANNKITQNWYVSTHRDLYTAPYDHYTAYYDHYTVYYDHYTAYYDHYGPYYTPYTCPA